MVENLPFNTLHHDGLTIEGYSRAAVQSYWRIPELKIGFDLGGSPWDFMNLPTIFITHAHLDHMAALPVYVARRRMMKMEPPTIYLPEENVEWADRLLKVWQKLDRGRMFCELVGVKAGQEIELSRDHVVTVFPTCHTVPSVGFLVWQRRKKLKPQFSALSYTRDTAPPGLDNYPPLYDAKILITELTFFRPEHRKEKIYKFGHMHLDDIIERADKFHNQLIIAMHFSTRYATNQIERAVMKKLPLSLRDKIKLWL